MRRRLLPEGTDRYCLAIGTAEPRKDLPGLVRAFATVAAHHADVALVLAGPEGWGEDELQAALDASPVRRPHRSHRLGPVDRTGRARCAARTWSPFPRATRGSGSHPSRPCGPAFRSWPRGWARSPRFSGTARCWSSQGTWTGWPPPSTDVSRTRRCGLASIAAGEVLGPPLLVGPLRRRTRAAVPGRTARCLRPTRSVLLAVEQLRRRVPGGIGAYARGLLAGLETQTPAAQGVALTLLASRAPAGRAASQPDPLAAFGKPVMASHLPGPLMTRAWDRGWLRAPEGFDVVHSVSLAAPKLRRGSTERARRHRARRGLAPPPRRHDAPGQALARAGAAAGGRHGQRPGRAVASGGGRPGGRWRGSGPAGPGARRLRSPGRSRSDRHGGPLAPGRGVGGIPADRGHARTAQERGPPRACLRAGAALVARALAAGHRRPVGLGTGARPPPARRRRRLRRCGPRPGPGRALPAAPAPSPTCR